MRKIIDILFIITLSRFYLNWILITNPSSHNPVIKFVWGWCKDGYEAKKYKSRFNFALIAGITHLFFAIMMFCVGEGLTLTNLLVNIYPVMVQLYIGYRCYIIIKHKEILLYGKMDIS